MDKDIQKLVDMEFNFDDFNIDSDPVEVTAKTNDVKESKICRDDFKFEPPKVDEPVETDVIPDNTACIQKYAGHVDSINKDMAIRRAKLEEFNKNIESRLTQFVYNIQSLIVYKAYYKIKSPGRRYDQIPAVTHKDLLSNYCIFILDMLEKANGLSIALPLDYTAFNYAADLKSYMSAISNRIDENNLNNLMYDSKKTLSIGTVKKMIDSINNMDTAPIDISVDYNKGNKIGLFIANTGFIQLKNDINKIISDISSFILDINEFAFLYDKKEVYDFISNELKKETVCGEPVEIEPYTDKTTEYPDHQDDYKDLDDNDNESMQKLKYWQKYASFLNIISLLPIYWTYGLILPKGLQKVPISWIPIKVISSTDRLMVLFITINGIVVFPVMWQFVMKPTGQEGSFLVQGVRGANKQIKKKTTSKVPPGLYGVDAIDIAPDITKVSPLEEDDLPQYKRLSMTNLLYLNYLRQWAQAATDIMGLQ
jgi:hypothetical protein